MLIFLKNTLTIVDEKLFKACKSVRLFARAITSEVPLPKNVKISTLYLNFLIDYCRDFSHVLHVCARPQVDSLM